MSVIISLNQSFDYIFNKKKLAFWIVT